MFLTKRHLSRRTVLKGAGVTLALPLLDAMIPAATALAQTAAKPKLRMGFFYIPHGAIMGNTSFGPEMDKWTPSGVRRRLQAQSNPEVARAAQELRHLVRQPAEPGDGGRRPQPRAGHVAERHEARAGLARREHVHHARSGGGAAHRPGHHAPVAGAGLGDDAAGGRLQQLGVLLQHHAVVPRRALAAAGGIQPAQGVRGAVRRRRHARGTGGDRQPDEEPAGSHHRPHARAAARPRRRRSRRARQLPGDRARDRAPRAAGVEPRPLGDRGARRRRSASSTRSASRSICCSS